MSRHGGHVELNCLNKILFPQPNAAPYAMLLQLARWFLRRYHEGPGSKVEECTLASCTHKSLCTNQITNFKTNILKTFHE